MKLRQLDKTNSRKWGNRKEASIMIATNGTFRLSQNAVQLMDTKLGDQVVLSQDEDCPTEWYICKVDTDQDIGFTIASGKKGATTFSSRFIGREIAICFGKKLAEINTIVLKLHENPIIIRGKTYWRLTFSKATDRKKTILYTMEGTEPFKDELVIKEMIERNKCMNDEIFKDAPLTDQGIPIVSTVKVNEIMQRYGLQDATHEIAAAKKNPHDKKNK